MALSEAKKASNKRYWYKHREKLLKYKRAYYQRTKVLTKWTSFRIKQTTKERLKHYARERGDSLNQVVNVLLEWGLERWDSQSPEALHEPSKRNRMHSDNGMDEL